MTPTMPATTQRMSVRLSEPVSRSLGKAASFRPIARTAHCIGRDARYASLDASNLAVAFAGGAAG